MRFGSTATLHWHNRLGSLVACASLLLVGCAQNETAPNATNTHPDASVGTPAGPILDAAEPAIRHEKNGEQSMPVEAAAVPADAAGAVEETSLSETPDASLESKDAAARDAAPADDKRSPDAGSISGEGAQSEGGSVRTVPVSDASGRCEPLVPLSDGGTMACSAPALPKLPLEDTGSFQDGGAACAPFSAEVAASQADAGNGLRALDTCFPSCIAELEAQCYPAGECAKSYGSESYVSCWENGIRRTSFERVQGTLRSIVVMMHSRDTLCYAVRIDVPPAGPAAYTWTDGCGRVVATGLEDAEDLTRVAVTCEGETEATLVNTTGPACTNHTDGAPYPEACLAQPVCVP
jgi:hypothetical protein